MGPSLCAASAGELRPSIRAGATDVNEAGSPCRDTAELGPPYGLSSEMRPLLRAVIINIDPPLCTVGSGGLLLFAGRVLEQIIRANRALLRFFSLLS